MSPQPIVALLGRKDRPTDAVEEYCKHLGRALVEHDFALEIRRVPWDEHGWRQAFSALRLQSRSWRNAWVLAQYTALAWSTRGFPRRFLTVLRILREAGARVAVVYHDVTPFGGIRLIDRLRRAYQVRVMQAAQRLVDKCVLTVALDRVRWLAASNENATFIPVGANLPFPLATQNHDKVHSPPAIGVFGITGGAAGERETRDVVAALRYASSELGSLRLLAFGRHAELRESALRQGLEGLPVDVQVAGIVDDGDLPARFAAIDVLLFVRGQISSRRGSAIAGIACGVPVIAVQGEETASPIVDAGVLLLRDEIEDDARQRALGESVVKLLRDEPLRLELIRRNHAVQETHFSWPAIAVRYAEFLRNSA